MALENTHNVCIDTYYSQQRICTRNGYKAILFAASHRVQKCESWQYSGFRLKLTKGDTHNIDHFPLVVDVELNNPSENQTLSSTPRAKWNTDILIRAW
eukprot:7789205-Pyramimonas_sp.AAC.1